jgi:hypothetical protein
VREGGQVPEGEVAQVNRLQDLQELLVLSRRGNQSVAAACL